MQVHHIWPNSSAKRLYTNWAILFSLKYAAAPASRIMQTQNLHVQPCNNKLLHRGGRQLYMSINVVTQLATPLLCRVQCASFRLSSSHRDQKKRNSEERRKKEKRRENSGIWKIKEKSAWKQQNIFDVVSVFLRGIRNSCRFYSSVWIARSFVRRARP